MKQTLIGQLEAEEQVEISGEVTARKGKKKNCRYLDMMVLCECTNDFRGVNRFYTLLITTKEWWQPQNPDAT